MENGASIVYNGFSAESYGITGGYIEYKVDPEIHIVSDENVNVSVRVISNVDMYFCAFDGLCLAPGKDLLKSNFLLEENKPANLLLDWMEETYDGSDIDIPLIKMTITAWDYDNPDNTITLNVQMGGFNTPVEKVVSQGNNITLSGKNLNYNFSSSAVVNIYSLSGKTVLNKKISGAGSINLSNLPSGVYLYRVEGKNGKTGKFVIK